MLSWALLFLIVAIVAAVLGFSGIAGAATNIAWILFVSMSKTPKQNSSFK